MAEVRYRVAATEGGTALLSGSVGVTGGTWSQALTIPSGIADGAAWWLGRSGLDDAGNAETWKWTQHFLAAVQTVSAFPQALGTLSAQPTWLGNFQSMFGAAHNPVTTQGTAVWPAPTRTVQFDTLPILDDSTLKVTSTGMTDFEKRWMGYFGNHTGYSGTRQAGDRLVLTEDATYVTAARNLDMPRFTADFELYAPGVTIQHTHANASTGLMENHAIRLLGDRQSLPTDGSVTDEQAQSNSARRIYIHGSKAKPAKLETIGAVGRTGLNQQGNTMLLVDPFVHDVIVEDVHGIAARAAGFFGYKGRRAWFNRCESIETQADAFHAANGCEDFLYTDCVSRRSGDDGIAPVRYSGEADTSSSKRIAYIRHRVIGTGHGRGTVSICNSDIYWDQCYIEGSAAAGFLWDREEGASSNPKGMANLLAQRMHLKGCNWSEQDHGTVFTNNGSGGVTVSGRTESVLVEDADPDKRVIRSDGSGVLQIVHKDMKAVGGPGGSPWWGGNNGYNGLGNAASTTTFDPAALRQETAGGDTTPPTLVWLAPGRKATVTGTTAEYPYARNSDGTPKVDTNGKRVPDLGRTGDYRNTMMAGYSGHVLGLTSTGVEIRLGDTVIGTIPKSQLDSAGRWYLEGVDYSRFRNGTGMLSMRATSNSGKTSTVVYRPITVSNASPGTLAIVPSDYTGVDRVTTGGSTPNPGDGGTDPGSAVTRTTMVYGADKPVVGTLTGVPAGTTLTDSEDTTTPLVISTAGTYRRQRYRRRVQVTVRGVRFEECEFTGGPTAHTSDHGLLQVTADAFVGATEAEDVQVVDCTFRPRALGNRVNGFLGWHTRFERCDFSRVVDPFGVHGFNWWNANGQPASYPSGFSAKGCTWHDLYFDAASYQSDGYTHNDGVQVQGGDNGVVLGCWGVARRDSTVGEQGDVGQYVGGRTLSNVLIQDNVGLPSGWVVDRNWFDAGHLSVNISSAITSLRVTGNRFDGTSSGRDINTDQTATARTGVVISGNTRTDGTTVNLRRGSTTTQDAPTTSSSQTTSASMTTGA